MTQTFFRDSSRQMDRSIARANALTEIEMLADCKDCTADFMRQEINRILLECKTRLNAITNGD